MKEGWKYSTIGDLFCSIKNGANIRQIKGAGGIPITRIETLANGVFNADRLGYADIADYNKFNLYYLNEGDILMSHINSLEHVGRSVVYHNELDKPLIHGMNLLRLVPKEINSDYCVYYFKTAVFKKDIISITHKSVNQASFNITSLKQIRIPVPPLSEQQSIVRYLDESFAKIDALKANAEKSLADAKAIFQAELKKAMEPKEGWEEKKLGEIAEYSIGLTYKPANVCEDGTIVLRSSNIQNGKLDLTEIVRVDSTIKEKLYVKEGDILMCSRNGSARLVGKVCIIPRLPEKMTYGTFMMIIRSEYNRLLYYFFDSDNFRKQIKHGEATMINQITRYMLDDVTVSLPPKSIQQSIVTHLDTLSAKVTQLQQNLERIKTECDALKQALLRQVFE